MILHALAPNRFDGAIHAQARDKLVGCGPESKEVIIVGIVKDVESLAAVELSAHLDMRPQSDSLIGNPIPRFAKGLGFARHRLPPEIESQVVERAMRHDPEEA